MSVCVQVGDESNAPAKLMQTPCLPHCTASSASTGANFSRESRNLIFHMESPEYKV